MMNNNDFPHKMYSLEQQEHGAYGVNQACSAWI